MTTKLLCKRAQNERPTDFADTDELIKDRKKRMRPTHAVDAQLSIAEGGHAYVKNLDVTVDYVLNAPLGHKPTLNALTATDAELADRLRRYCQKDDMALLQFYSDIEHYETLSEWKGKTLKNPVLVSLPLGEVLNADYKLLGCVDKEGQKMTIPLDDKLVYRAQIIMEVSGEPKSSEKHTADHIDCEKPLDDSTGNLRWASKSEQNKNRRKAESIQRTAQTIHLVPLNGGEPLQTFHGTIQAAEVLKVAQATVRYRIKNKTIFKYDGQQCTLVVDDPQPPEPYYTYPELMKGDQARFQCAGTGQYRTLLNNGKWGSWRFVESRASIELDNETSRLLSIVLYECFSGKKVNSKTHVVDHKDNDPRNNSKENLRKITYQENAQRREIKMVVRLESNGNKTLYASQQRAAEANKVHAGGISDCLTGRYKSTGGFKWRDASVDEIRHFFSTMV